LPGFLRAFAEVYIFTIAFKLLRILTLFFTFVEADERYLMGFAEVFEEIVRAYLTTRSWRVGQVGGEH
jgi:hypothetical protein